MNYLYFDSRGNEDKYVKLDYDRLYSLSTEVLTISGIKIKSIGNSYYRVGSYDEFKTSKELQNCIIEILNGIIIDYLERNKRLKDINSINNIK